MKIGRKLKNSSRTISINRISGGQSAWFKKSGQRERFGRFPCSFDGAQIPLRVSVGAAQYQKEKESLSELMNRADKALYRAKSEGRNKVVEAE